jgi:hypothetical protein
MSMIKSFKIVYGKKSRAAYRDVYPVDLLGKTIEAIGYGTIDTDDGQMPCTVVLFTDGSRHAFVHPQKDE